MKIDYKIIWEAVKEPLRELVLAIIPFLLQYFQAVDTQWAIIIYLILRGIDAWLHEMGKSEDRKEYITGLTRF